MSDDLMKLTDLESDALSAFLIESSEAIAEKLSSLLECGVTPFEPEIFSADAQEAMDALDLPVCAVTLSYAPGYDGYECFVFNQSDVSVLLDVIAGVELTDIPEEPREFDELRTVASGELMNSMIRASTETLSRMVTLKNDPAFAPPVIDSGSLALSRVFTGDVAMIYTDVTVEGFEPFRYARVMSAGLAVSIARSVAVEAAAKLEPLEPTVTHSPEPEPVAPPTIVSAAVENAEEQPPVPQVISLISSDEKPQPAVAETAAHDSIKLNADITKRPVQYVAFNSSFNFSPTAADQYDETVGMISDVPLQVSVELGRTYRDINDILNFGLGTNIVLDKNDGDPVEIYVNGKLTARGLLRIHEYEEIYCVEITEIMRKS